MYKILVVDDDEHIRQFVSIYLIEAGYTVITAKDGADALRALEKNAFDLAVVDIMMPGIDGYELTEMIRDYYDLPIIMLTAKGQIEDKEKGFLSGTDDYIVKPFEPKELLYRIKVLLRLYEKQTDHMITFGQTTINQRNYEVTVADETFILPLKEFEVLALLASHQGQVLTREQIVEHVWGLDYDGDERTVDVHIKRLREHFSNVTNDFEIVTRRGVGYVLEAK